MLVSVKFEVSPSNPHGMEGSLCGSVLHQAQRESITYHLLSYHFKTIIVCQTAWGLRTPLNR